MGQKIIALASLSFLGLGIQPPDSDWGAMLARARGVMEVAPHVVAVPGAAIFVVVLSCNFIGDALRDALDPRLR
jgi:ABC-type dipeptide/oligopeptide/nickel transport system permease subunit